MTGPTADTRSVIVEREMPGSPDKVWRALTQPLLLEEWLMTNDFAAVVGHPFAFRADWGSVACRVLAVEPNKTLSYTWDARGLQSVVTWTLTPTGSGTHLRMEQSGFQADQNQAFGGARYGWNKFLGNMEQLLARIA